MTRVQQLNRSGGLSISLVLQEPAQVWIMVLCEEEFDLLTHCNDGQRSNALKQTFPIVAVGLVWTNALAIALGSGLPVVAAEVRVQSIKERAADDVPHIQLAQFQLPEHKKEMFRRRGADPPSPLIQRLKFEYSYGSESEIVYRADPDLNKGVKDNLLILTPELNGFIRYRPTDWLEGTLEMIFAGEIPVLKEDSIVLADGEIQMVPDTQFSLLVDQLYVTIKDITAPFRFTVGRRNYEDERHWLYDTSMDIASVSVKLGKFRAEVLAGREVMWHLDLITKEERDLINTYIFYADYRGIEDIKLAAYTIYRDDREGLEGRPLLMGVRSQGAPSETFSYWLELAHMRGSICIRRGDPCAEGR